MRCIMPPTQTPAYIRVVTIEDQPWFVAREVCLALGTYLKADGTVNANVTGQPSIVENPGMDPSGLTLRGVRVPG